MSSSSFKSDFEKLIKRAGDKAELLVRHSMLSISKAVDTRAPVDTGRFRANTNVAVGAMDTSTSYQPDQSGIAAQGRLQTALAAWKPGQTLYITTSLPYAKKLEYGSSKQSPNGVFRITVQEFEDHVKRAASQIR